jgi:hypothetical protein
MKIKIVLFILLIFCIPLFTYSLSDKTIYIKGLVIDSESNDPLPAVSVALSNEDKLFKTDKLGLFSIPLDSMELTRAQLKISSLGYETKMIKLANTENDLIVKLNPRAQSLSEIIVRGRKYQNKNNPAVALIDLVIANKKKNRMEAIGYYDTQKYEKIQFALTDITLQFKQNRIFKNFQFMFIESDSTGSKGGEMMPIFMKETLSKIYYRKSPRSLKERIHSNKMVEFENLDNKGLEANIQYMYQDIDIYENNITLLTNQFLSPIAPTAPSFYRYYIMDTIQSGGEKYTKLFFGARNKQDMLFQGYLFIAMDGTYSIKGIELSVNKNINLNWVKDVKIIQQFEKAGNKGLMLTSEQSIMDFGITKRGQNILGKRSVYFKNYNFDPPANDSIFSGPNTAHLDSAKRRDEAYWLAKRPQPLSKSEADTYLLIDSVQKVPEFRRVMDIATVIIQGYKGMGKYEIGPVNTFYSYNPIEGIRARVGGRTTPAFSKKLNFDSYIGYGFRDGNYKYYLSSTWSFTPRSIYEFPVKSLKASIQQDTKFPGQDLQFVQEDNIFLSIKRGVNDKLFYNKSFKLEQLNEFDNHFSYSLGYQFTQTATGGNIFFNRTDYLSHLNDVNSIDISELSLKLRYAPNEKFYQGKTFRIPILSKYPVIDGQLSLGSKGISNDYDYQNVRLSISKRFYFSVLGYSDLIWEGGKIFGQLPYPLLFIHRANQSYSYQILSYNLMNFLEFVSDQYSSLNIDHCFNGFIINKVPLVKELEFREYLTFKILDGSISERNDPNKQTNLFKFPVSLDGKPYTSALGKSPYIEGSIGIGNILRFFRVDLVKRFTYLDHPNVSSYGLRLRFRFDF